MSLLQNIIEQRRQMLMTGQRPSRLLIDLDSFVVLSRELPVGNRVLGLDIEITPEPNFEVL